jgi:hypothetical protein
MKIYEWYYDKQLLSIFITANLLLIVWILFVFTFNYIISRTYKEESYRKSIEAGIPVVGIITLNGLVLIASCALFVAYKIQQLL